MSNDENVFESWREDRSRSFNRFSYLRKTKRGDSVVGKGPFARAEQQMIRFYKPSVIGETSRRVLPDSRQIARATSSNVPVRVWRRGENKSQLNDNCTARLQKRSAICSNSSSSNDFLLRGELEREILLAATFIIPRWWFPSKNQVALNNPKIAKNCFILQRNNYSDV